MVSKIPYKVLDAPGLIDDFYVDLLHWSLNDLIGVSLQNNVYLWDFKTLKASKLTDTNQNSP